MFPAYVSCLRGEDFPGFGIDELLGGWLRFFLAPRPRLLEPVALTVHLENVDVMGKAIEQRAGGRPPLGDPICMLV